MMKTQYNVILIDFYGVICPNTTHLWLRSHVQNLDADMDFYHKLLEKNNRGDITKDEFYQVIGERTNNDPSAVKEGINSYISIDQEIIKLLKGLKKKYQIALVSNSSGLILRQIIKNYGLEKLFDRVFISAEMHSIKPEEIFFNTVLDSIRQEPKTAVFIDDNKKNVQAAKNLGIESILYTDSVDLSNKLRTLGVLP